MTKNALFGTLDCNVAKNTCNQRPPIYLMAKFRAKIRILKFGTKDDLFEKQLYVENSALEFASFQSLV